MKINKKTLSILSVLCAFVIIFSGVFAFFSDSSILNNNTKVGTVNIDVEGDLIHSTNLNNLNPGDNDIDVPEKNHPGTDHELSFEITNQGNKSIIYRTIIEVSAVKNNDTPFTAEELMSIILSEKQNVIELTTSENINNTDADKYNTVDRLDATGYSDNKLTYILGGTTENGFAYVLNGTGENAETETNVTVTNAIQTIDIGLDKDISADIFEGASITFNVIVQAMQYRNTGDEVWETIYSKTFATDGAPESTSPEFISNEKLEEMQAFAIYSADDNSLSFYKNFDNPQINDIYNDKTVTKIYYDFENTEFELKEDLPWFNELSLVKKVVFVNEIKPTSLRFWFSGMTNCTSMDLKKLNTEKTTSLYDTFYKCEKLSELDVSTFDTKNVTDMDYTFQSTGFSVNSFKITGLENWDTSNVTTMKYMFNQTGYNAKTINISDVSNWDVSNVTNMYGTFMKTGFSATEWYIGNFTNWDVSSVTDMQLMFNHTGYSTPNWNIGSLENWDVSNVTNMKGMFTGAAYNANTFDLGNLNNWNVSKVTNMGATSKIEGDTITATGMFMSAGINAKTWNIGQLDNWDVSNVEEMSCIFSSAGKNATIFNIGNLNNWNVSKVKDMNAIFLNAGSTATTVNIGDLSSWNTSSCTTMWCAFSNFGTQATYSLDLSKWDVSKVTEYSNFDNAVSSKIISPWE